MAIRREPVDLRDLIANVANALGASTAAPRIEAEIEGADRICTLTAAESSALTTC